MAATLDSQRPVSQQRVAGSRWEDDLASLLEELTELQDQLLEVLAQKRERMAKGDVSGMAQLQPTEEMLCQRLEKCHGRRGELLAAASRQGLPANSLGSLAGALHTTGDGQLRRDVKTVSSRMRLLQHQSLTNWVLAQKSLLHLSQMLEIIATKGRRKPTYGEDHGGRDCGALMDQEI